MEWQIWVLLVGVPTLLILQMGYIFWSFYMHQKERRDLYNRIMAGNLYDYHVNESRPAIGKRSNYLEEAFKKQERMQQVEDDE